MCMYFILIMIYMSTKEFYNIKTVTKLQIFSIELTNKKRFQTNEIKEKFRISLKNFTSKTTI